MTLLLLDRMQQAISKLDHLTSLALWGDCDCSAVVYGLTARSDQCNAQLRSLQLGAELTKESEKMLMELVLRVRPILEVLSAPLSISSLFAAQKEEREKGSGRLLYSNDMEVSAVQAGEEGFPFEWLDSTVGIVLNISNTEEEEEDGFASISLAPCDYLHWIQGGQNVAQFDLVTVSETFTLFSKRNFGG